MSVKRIEKSLTAEEKSVIANVRSLLDQLEQMEQAEGAEGALEDGGLPPGEDINMAATDGLPCGDEEQEEFEEDKIEKSEVANEDAEVRVEELPEDDEAALKVLKAIMSLGGGSHPAAVRKSARSASPADSVQYRTLKVLKSLSERLDQQGEAIAGLLEGIGVAEQVVAKSRRPVNPRQNSAVEALRAIVDAARGTRVEKSLDAQEPEGSLSDVLGTLFVKE